MGLPPHATQESDLHRSPSHVEGSMPDADRVILILTEALHAIQIRCREGDPRIDWLPTIDHIATEALRRTT